MRRWRAAFGPVDDPIGKRLRIDMLNEPSREIVGVVGDIRQRRYESEAQPRMYVPYVQHSSVTQGRFVEPRLNMTFRCPFRRRPAAAAIRPARRRNESGPQSTDFQHQDPGSIFG